MVDPFATQVAEDKHSDTTSSGFESKLGFNPDDIFGGDPSVFAAMQPNAFQPIDPKTGKPTEHTAETLDPFLRDDLSDVSVDGQAVNPFTIESSQEEPVDYFGVISEDSSHKGETIENPIPGENTSIEEPIAIQKVEMPVSDLSEDLASSKQSDVSDGQDTPIQVIEESMSIEQPNQEQQTIPVQEPIAELPADAQIPSYFDTTVSSDDTVTPAFDTSVAETVTTSSVTSDHYDPFIDEVMDQSDSMVSDDPFLQNEPDEMSVATSDQDPFLEGEEPSDVGYSQEKEESITPSAEFTDTLLDQEVSVDEPVEENLPVDEIVVQQDVVKSTIPFSELSSIASSLESESLVPQEDISSTEQDTTDDVVLDDTQDTNTVAEHDGVDGGLYSLDNEAIQKESLSSKPDETADTQPEIEFETSADSGESDDAVQAQHDPSMIQGLVEGMLDPFMSSKPLVDEETQIDSELVQEVLDESTSDELVDDALSEETIAPGVVASAIQEETEEVEEPVVDQETQEPVATELTVNEDEQNIQKTGKSDVFIKFQELLQSIYRVHDMRGGHDSFTIVGADNDAFYITYSFTIDSAVEQAIVVTKESTDRKSENAIDTHTLRFAINSNSLVEVYVDGVLLFVEDQLVDNVKAKMQLIDKFNKFIFLVNTYVDSLAEQARIMQDTQEAKENFQQF